MYFGIRPKGQGLQVHGRPFISSVAKELVLQLKFGNTTLGLEMLRIYGGGVILIRHFQQIMLISERFDPSVLITKEGLGRQSLVNLALRITESGITDERSRDEGK